MEKRLRTKSADEKLITDHRKHAVVTARGGDPKKVTEKEYREKYSDHEKEVTARYPTLNLAEIRDSTKDGKTYDDQRGFLQEKANEEGPSESHAGVIDSGAGVTGTVTSGGGSKAPTR